MIYDGVSPFTISPLPVRYKGVYLGNAMSPLDTNELKKRREKLHLSQRALAKLAGVHQPRIVEREAGKRANISLDTLERLANALDCEPGALLKATRKRAK